MLKRLFESYRDKSPGTYQIQPEEINACWREEELEMQSRIIGTRIDEVKGNWRKLHIVLVKVLSPKHNIFRVIK